MKFNKRTYYLWMFLLALAPFLVSLANFLFWGMITLHICSSKALLVLVAPLPFFVLICYSLYMLHKLKPNEKGQKIELDTLKLLSRIFVLLILLLFLWLSLTYFCVTPLRDMCVLPAGLRCSDYLVERERIQFLIENDLGKDIILKRVVVTETSSPPLHRCEMTFEEITIPNRGFVPLTVDDCSITSVTVRDKYHYDIDVTFQYLDSEEEHTSQGELFTTVTET